ncbi:hypothetical protein [Maribacter spongiicola]|uniref:hypothetical protein n=1 Tax=Maribacter spongiicola TaxID=1206753 RepID=UPI003F9A0ADF
MCLLFSLVVLNSCSNEEDDVFVYEGYWSGQYTSNVDSGNWSIRIDMNKTVIGTFTPTQSSYSYQIIGTITESGVLNADIKTSEIIGEFSGTFIDDIASGLWTMNSDDDSGNWTGVKL